MRLPTYLEAAADSGLRGRDVLLDVRDEARRPHHISVCTNISCMLRGGDEIVAHVERKLGIKTGESTPTARFYLKREEECLAACCGAPMMMVDHVYYENLTPEKVDEVLDDQMNKVTGFRASGIPRDGTESRLLRDAAVRASPGRSRLPQDRRLRGVAEDPERRARPRERSSKRSRRRVCAGAAAPAFRRA
jgi:(2Fe-2S) ferredoxin